MCNNIPRKMEDPNLVAFARNLSLRVPVEECGQWWVVKTDKPIPMWGMDCSVGPEYFDRVVLFKECPNEKYWKVLAWENAEFLGVIDFGTKVVPSPLDAMDREEFCIIKENGAVDDLPWEEYPDTTREDWMRSDVL